MSTMVEKKGPSETEIAINRINLSRASLLKVSGGNFSAARVAGSSSNQTVKADEDLAAENDLYVHSHDLFLDSVLKPSQVWSAIRHTTNW